MPKIQSGLLPNKPALFSPTVIRTLRDGNASVFESTTPALTEQTALGSSSSFRYDTFGLKSTQQLNVDYSKYSNHTFFNSARIKTNVAFERIINGFPFDGTQTQMEKFFDGLTGFEKYVYDLFPTNTGYLFFSGTNGNESTGGTYITTIDKKGAAYPTLTDNPTGDYILNPVSKSMTLEFQLFVSPVSNSNQIILQKYNQTLNHGFSVVLNNTGSLVSASLGFYINSGSYSINTTFDIPKNQFNHMAFIWNRIPGIHRVEGHVNHLLFGTSSNVEIGSLSFDSSNFYIGSGSSFSSFTPTNTFSGALDELRIWHSIRSIEERKEFEKQNVYTDGKNLKLYYRFNEPSGSNADAVLDYSSNGLHGSLSTFALTLGTRETLSSSAGVSPLTYERPEINPVLFNTYPAIETLIDSFEEQAEIFDNANPSRIDRLVPNHYFQEGQQAASLITEEGTIVDPNTYDSNNPKSAKLGNSQVLLILLYMWAKYFDELKLYLDAFGNMNHVSYDDIDTIPDMFLQTMASKFGIELPQMFSGADIGQFIQAKNINQNFGIETYNLQYIQNQMWKRILINLKDILGSKGTIHSIKSFVRALGIDPDNNFRIREFGGPTKRSIGTSREKRSEISTLLNFTSGGLTISNYLSSSRREPGFPTIQGTLVNGVSNQPNDGLWTSGSWTFEGIYQYPSSSNHSITSSLFRLYTTGSSTPSSGSLILNLLATKAGKIDLFAMPNRLLSSSYLSMSLTGANIFDGDAWNISIGKYRNDQINSTVSSSYFIRASKQSFGEITEVYSSSQYYNESVNSGSSVWNTIDSQYNASGSFVVIGSSSIQSNSSFLNDTTNVIDYARNTIFDGKLGQLRFWSKGLELEEWKEHVRNFKSIGVKDPKKNFNFTTTPTGSFEKLRFDVSTDQPITQSTNLGTIQLFDFSQNNNHFSGTNFATSSNVIQPQKFYYSFLSPHFDEGTTDNKIRIRSFSNFSNVLNDENHYAVVAPLHSINKSDEPTDSEKFSIDFSIVDTLNQDIVNMFSSLDEFNNAIGNPELMYSPDYPSLETLRNVYFNRLTDKINLKTFFEFYQYFDTHLSGFISQLIPRKTKYLGTNYIVSSHMLERFKYEYKTVDQYLGDSNRLGLNTNLFLQFFVGKIGRY